MQINISRIDSKYTWEKCNTFENNSEKQTFKIKTTSINKYLNINIY